MINPFSSLLTQPANPFLPQPFQEVPEIPKVLPWELEGGASFAEVLGEGSPTSQFLEKVSSESGIIDVRKEVSQLEALRDRLEDHNQQRSAAEARKAGKRFRQRLHSSFEGGFSSAEDWHILDAAESAFLENYPTVDFTLDLAKEYRNISKDISSLMERYQKIVKGIKLQVEFTSEHYDRIIGAVYAECDNATIGRIANRLEKDAAVEGKEEVVRL